MSLVVVANCGAWNALHGLEISIFQSFLKLYFIRISKDIVLRWAQNAIRQCKWYFSRKLLCQGLCKCTIGKSTIMLVRTAVSYMIHDFWKIAVLGGGKYKVYYRREFYTRDHKNNYCELENYLLLICIQFKLICGTFLRYKQIYGEKLPLLKIRENKLCGQL